MTTVIVGVSSTDAALFHLLELPEGFDPAGAPQAVDAMLESYREGGYPPEYLEVAWIASDDAAIAELVAVHYGVEVRPAPAPPELVGNALPPIVLPEASA